MDPTNQSRALTVRKMTKSSKGTPRSSSSSSSRGRSLAIESGRPKSDSADPPVPQTPDGAIVPRAPMPPFGQDALSQQGPTSQRDSEPSDELMPDVVRPQSGVPSARFEAHMHHQLFDQRQLYQQLNQVILQGVDPECP